MPRSELLVTSDYSRIHEEYEKLRRKQSESQIVTVNQSDNWGVYDAKPKPQVSFLLYTIGFQSARGWM